MLLYNLTCTVYFTYISRIWQITLNFALCNFVFLHCHFVEEIFGIDFAKFTPLENFALYAAILILLAALLACGTCNVHVCVTKVILKLRDGRSYYVRAHAIMALACTAHVQHVLAKGYDIHWQLFVFFLFCTSCDVRVCVCVCVCVCVYLYGHVRNIYIFASLY